MSEATCDLGLERRRIISYPMATTGAPYPLTELPLTTQIAANGQPLDAIAWRSRCLACRLPSPLCVCHHIPRLPTLARTARLVFIVHTKELRRLSNTARLLDLVYARNGGDCQIVKQGLIDRPVHTQLAAPLASDGRSFVLFPGGRSRPLTPDHVSAMGPSPRIIVPDGNWGQANQMMKRLPMLAGLPVFSLPNPPQNINCMRKNIYDDRMSTYEATAQAIGLFGGVSLEEELISFLRRAADRILHMRGRLKSADIHGGISRG